MLGKLWRWLKSFLMRLLGKRRAVSPILGEHSLAKGLQQLSDAEYESKFLQLLSGVDSAWSLGKVKGFLDGNNISQDGLIVWLRRFGDRLLKSDAPNDELGQQMVQLGELGFGELEEIAPDIGVKLLTREGKKETDVPGSG